MADGTAMSDDARLPGEGGGTRRHCDRGLPSAAHPAAIPNDVLRKWQRIVDLLASIVRVPSAVVTLVEPLDGAYYTTVVSSHSAGNPFPADQVFSMDIGTFCETVIKRREPLLVACALEDDRWKSAPEIQVGMISYLGFPVFWPDGRMFGTICVLDDKANPYSESYQELLVQCRDVLQEDLQTLERLGGELEEQRTHLNELFTRVPEAIVMIDRDSRITRVNPEFTRIFGYAPEAAIGRSIVELITPDDARDAVEAGIERLFVAREASAVETLGRHWNGARVPVSLLCVPVSSTARGAIGYLIYRDITEAKRLQDEQRRYHELELELAHVNRIATLGQLSASIAHELTQPLTGIITNCGTCLRMLSGAPPNLDGAREVAQRTLRDGTRASEIITQLRALFTRQTSAAEPVDLNDATREVIALSLGEIERRRAALRMELAVDLPRVTGDRVQLQQVVLNLMRNAMDAMSAVDDRPRELLIKTRSEDGDTVRLSVTDAGVGFDAATAHRLFDAFYSTKADGMGVGLSVSRSIIENHQGRLSAVLNDGPGATFSFSIPSRRDC